MAEKASVLVVANRTARSDELLQALKERAERGPAEFTLLIPASAHGVAWIGDMHSGSPEASRDLDAALDRFRKEGLDMAEAKVGDADPLAAVEDAVNFGSFDEVICSTLPTHLSKWLKLDLPHRIERETGLPVTHVVGSDAVPNAG